MVKKTGADLANLRWKRKQSAKRVFQGKREDGSFMTKQESVRKKMEEEYRNTYPEGNPFDAGEGQEIEAVEDPKITDEDLRGAARVLRYNFKFTKKKIARTLKMNKNTVRTWVSRENPRRKARIAVRKITPEIELFIQGFAQCKWTVTDKRTLDNLRHAVFERFNVKVSRSTMHKTTKKLFGYALAGKKTFQLTMNHKKKRVIFCDRIIKDKVKGENILFTDEKIFTLRKYASSSTNKMWVPKAMKKEYLYGQDAHNVFTNLKREYPKYDAQVMVAGGISSFGVTKLVFCIGNVDTFAYSNILDVFNEHIDKVKKDHGVQLCFQQDSAPPHVSRESLSKIKKLFGDNVISDWPANSPDLSPIELLWKELEKQLRMKEYETIEELKNALQLIWNSIPLSLCQRLMQSFEKRTKWVFDNLGNQYAHYAMGILDENGKIMPEKVIREPKVNYKFDNLWNPVGEKIEKVTISKEKITVLRKRYTDSIEKMAKKLIKTYFDNHGGHASMQIIDSMEFQAFKMDVIMPILYEKFRYWNVSDSEFFEKLVPERFKVLSIDMHPRFTDTALTKIFLTKEDVSTRADLEEDEDENSEEAFKNIFIKYKVVDVVKSERVRIPNDKCSVEAAKRMCVIEGEVFQEMMKKTRKPQKSTQPTKKKRAVTTPEERDRRKKQKFQALLRKHYDLLAGDEIEEKIMEKEKIGSLTSKKRLRSSEGPKISNMPKTKRNKITPFNFPIIQSDLFKRSVEREIDHVPRPYFNRKKVIPKKSAPQRKVELEDPYEEPLLNEELVKSSSKRGRPAYASPSNLDDILNESLRIYRPARKSASVIKPNLKDKSEYSESEESGKIEDNSDWERYDKDLFRD